MTKEVVVIGYSSHLPNGEHASETWNALLEGVDSITETPPDRLDVTAYYNPQKGTPDKVYCKHGGYISPFHLTPREFGLNMLQLEDMDANQTLTLLKVKHALQHAGDASPCTSGRKERMGVVIATDGMYKLASECMQRMTYPIVEQILRKVGLPEASVAQGVETYKQQFPEWRLDSFPGFLPNVTAGRVTNVFDLDGMNCVIDAACASSMAALRMAMNEILHGDCETMIAGSTCTDNGLALKMAFSKTPVFSTQTKLTAYDEKTEGMLIGEGSIMLVLKEKSAALRDGNTIYATVKACRLFRRAFVRNLHPDTSWSDVGLRTRVSASRHRPQDDRLNRGAWYRYPQG